MGALVILLSPFIVLAFALFAIYSLFKLIIIWIVAIVKFFMGEKITDPLEIDRQAAEIFEQQQLEKKKAPTPTDGKFAGATIHIYGQGAAKPDFDESKTKVDVIDVNEPKGQIEEKEALLDDPIAALLEDKKDD